MVNLVAFPPQDPRIVRLKNARVGLSPFGNLKSRRSSLAWTVARVPGVGRALWRQVDADVAGAWSAGAELLGVPSDDVALRGILSDPRLGRRLVILAESVGLVAKVGIDALGGASIGSEAANYDAVKSACGRPDLFPKHDYREGALVLELLRGGHPTWDDPAAHAWIMTKFVMSGGRTGIFHGDVTPWNLVSDAVGGFRVLDVEAFDATVTVRPHMNLLDFVLRGAVLRTVGADALRSVLVAVSDLDLTQNLMDEYVEYRAVVARATGANAKDEFTLQAEQALLGVIQRA